MYCNRIEHFVQRLIIRKYGTKYETKVYFSSLNTSSNDKDVNCLTTSVDWKNDIKRRKFNCIEFYFFETLK